ncbi:uncharacterized protein LOC132738602 [Ruditapes philippinarum]|uniref:uncharacterized protein LOC132738602 n=1 Tax=Ruditapes philippinarum TaxID=129788 RepID=UPI00295BF232|nr:uncharacterized protein LOC132738602 [Ruditapes philippinarum]
MTGKALAFLLGVLTSIQPDCNALECFNCKSIGDVHDCNITSVCSSGESCSTVSAQPTAKGTARFNMGCIQNQLCGSTNTAGIAVGKRQKNIVTNAALQTIATVLSVPIYNRLHVLMTRPKTVQSFIPFFKYVKIYNMQSLFVLDFAAFVMLSTAIGQIGQIGLCVMSRVEMEHKLELEPAHILHLSMEGQIVLVHIYKINNA